MSEPIGLRLVAILEASKGCLALVVGLGLHALAGQNVQQVAERFVRHLHLDPANHFPKIFIAALGGISGNWLGLLAIGAALYSLVRFIEAYGLWHGMRWTEWFALVSGAIYIPFEVYGIVVHWNMFSIGALVINVLVVWYMSSLLFRPGKNTGQASVDTNAG